MKKWIAMLLVLAMVISLAPAVYAQEHEETPIAAEAGALEIPDEGAEILPADNDEVPAEDMPAEEELLVDLEPLLPGEGTSGNDIALPSAGCVEPEITVVVLEEDEVTVDAFMAEPESDLATLAEQYEPQFSGLFGWGLLDNYDNGAAMRAVYAAVYDGLTRGDELPNSIGIADSTTGVTTQEAMIAADIMFYDHPELILFASSGGFTIYEVAGQALYYSPALSDSFGDLTEVRAALKQIDDKMDPILKEIMGRSDSEFELVQGVHDWLCLHAGYDYSLEGQNTHNMAGAILNRSCVCDGYAHAFQYLLRKCGIESFVVTGDAGESHAWNLVKIDGKWSWFDVTWDDNGIREEDIYYSYFGITDEILEEDHTPDAAEGTKDYYRYLPKADSLDAFYHYVNHSMVTNQLEVDEVCPLFKKDLARVYVTDKGDEAFLFWYTRHFDEIIQKLGISAQVPADIPCRSHEYHLKLVEKEAEVVWDLSPTGVLTIEGRGQMPDYFPNTRPWELETSYIYEVVVGEGITGIGDYAFYNCVSLTSVTLPSTLRSIGEYAFYSCHSLVSIQLPDSLQSIGRSAFSVNISLTELHLPNAVSSIGSYAFYLCENLNTVTMETSTGLSIDKGAFGSCHSLHTVRYNGTLADWLSLQFDDEGSNPMCNGADLYFQGELVENLTIPAETKSIPICAFTGCRSLKTVSFPESLTRIKAGAFESCLNLDHVAVPNGVYRLEERAFKGCCALRDITLPQALAHIGDECFKGCTDLAAITLPDSVIEIWYSAFENCSSLAEIIIPKNVTVLADYVFDGCSSLTAIHVASENKYYQSEDGTLFTRNKTEFIRFPEGKQASGFTALPDNINAIHAHAFQDCKGLESLQLPAGLESISEGMFRGCSVLRSVVIPESVVSMGEGAFEDCCALEGVRIPTGVKSISAYTFSGCISLENIFIPAGLVEFSNYVFGSSSLPFLKGISFGGSEAQWKRIAKAINPILTSGDVPVYYNQLSEVSQSGCFWMQCDSCLAVFGCGELALLPEALASVVTEAEVHEGVTAIGARAFSGFSAMEKLTLPASLQAIGDGAFTGCVITEVQYKGTDEQWDSIAIGEDNAALLGANRLNAIAGHFGDTISWRLTSDGTLEISGQDHLVFYFNTIQDFSDQYQERVKRLVIRDGIIGISRCFRGYENLEEVILPDSISVIEGSAFSDCVALKSVALPANVTEIENSAFSGCRSLVSITIPAGVTQIGKDAFSGCQSLTAIEIPEGVTNIGEYTFQQCSALISVKLPESLTNIGMAAFDRCTSLASIEIPEGVSAIGFSAFSMCTSLKEIVIPGSVINIGGSAFSHCSSLTSVEFRDGTTVIGGFAFSSCSALTSVVIPGSVTDMGESAFGDCSSLTSVEFRDGATVIGSFAFSSCSALTFVVIPASITEIGTGAFNWCDSLEQISFEGSRAQWRQLTGDKEIGLSEDVTIIYGPNTCAHVLEEHPATEPTCDSDGNRLYWSCSLCGEYFGDANGTESVEEGSWVLPKAHTPETLGGKEASCTEEGETGTVICSVCHEVLAESEVIPMEEHKAGPAVKEGEWEAGCEWSGGYEMVTYCTVCGDEVTRETVDIPPTGHKEGPAVRENECEATCEASGSYDRVVYCEYCWAELTRVSIEIPQLNHVYAVVPQVEPTCTEAGSTMAVQCSLCGHCLLESAEIPAKGHSYDEGEVTTEASCTEAGVKTYTCTACGDTKVEEIPAKGHTLVSDGAVPPTRTETGLTDGGYCSVCGEVFQGQTVIPATGHTYDQGKITKPSTCTEEGEILFTCTVCGASRTDSIEKAAHTEVTDMATAAGCMTSGLTEGSHCSVCKEVIVPQVVIPAIGHHFDNGRITTEATCTETGIRTYTCTVCGTVKTEEVPSMGHTVVSIPAVEAGCTEPGLTEGSHCSACGEVFVPQEEIPASGHTYQNGVCTACGQVLMGDIVTDGVLNIKDVSALFHIIADGESIANGDVNGDGRVSLKDVYALFLMLAS